MRRGFCVGPGHPVNQSAQKQSGRDFRWPTNCLGHHCGPRRDGVYAWLLLPDLPLIGAVDTFHSLGAGWLWVPEQQFWPSAW